ncbi:MAG: hypothetical protein R2849_10345 [Thermomicrobiales bacterium]
MGKPRLVEPAPEERSLNGEGRATGKRVDWERQFELALRAFEGMDSCSLPATGSFSIWTKRSRAARNRCHLPATRSACRRLGVRVGFRESSKAAAEDRRPDETAASFDTRAASLLDDLRNEVSDFIESRRRLMPSYLAMDELKIGELESGRKILDLDADGQIAVVRAAVDASFPARAGHFTWTYMLRDRVSGLVANQILRRKLPYSRQDVEWLLTRIAVSQSDWNSLEMSAVSAQSLLRSIERWTQGDGEISESARASLRRLREGITRSYFSTSGRKFLDLIDVLIGVEEARGSTPATIGATMHWPRSMD